MDANVAGVEYRGMPEKITNTSGCLIAGADLTKPLVALFINSPLKDYGTHPRHNDYTLPVLGMAYIATACKAAGLNVGILDAESNGLALDEVARIVDELRPAWVGLNLLAPTYELSVKLLQKLDSSINVLLGGHQAKAMPEEILADPRIPRIDALVLGEGESRVVEILKKTSTRNFLPDVLWRTATGNHARGSELGDKGRWLAPNVDEMPMLNREFLTADPYLRLDGVIESNMVGSRGCPYNCSFCGAARSANPDVTIRTRDPKGILREMNHLHTTYGVTHVRFVDDLFLARPSFIRDYLQVFKDDRVGERMTWEATGRINVLAKMDGDMLAALVDSGCREVALGIESGSDRMLDRIDKQITRKMIVEAASRVLGAGINVKGYFILGFPTETRSEMLETSSLISELWSIADRSLGDLRVSVFEFRPYPGTPEWHRLLEAGYKSTELLNYEHVDLTDSEGQSGALNERDEFNFSVGIQFGEVPPTEIRRELVRLTSCQYERKLRLVDDKPTSRSAVCGTRRESLVSAARGDSSP